MHGLSRPCVGFPTGSTDSENDPYLFLQDCRVKEEQVSAIIKEANVDGVQQFVVNGCWQEDWNLVLSLAEKYKGCISPQLGLHPWWVGHKSVDWYDRLTALLEQHPHAGLGECGLDKGARALHAAHFDQQLQAFELQLQLANRLKRPVSIHCVKAYGPVVSALERLRISVPVVLHAWTGSADMTIRFLKLPSVYFSLNGYITKIPPNRALPMVRAVPLERLLLESDAPDGSIQLNEDWTRTLSDLGCDPQFLSQKLDSCREYNTPSAVRRVLSLVAAVQQQSEEEVASATTANARRIFCFD